MLDMWIIILLVIVYRYCRGIVQMSGKTSALVCTQCINEIHYLPVIVRIG